jgi:hypothetical protein
MKAGANCSIDRLGDLSAAAAETVAAKPHGASLSPGTAARSEWDRGRQCGELGSVRTWQAAVRLRSVEAVALQLRQNFPLTGNMLLAECNVFLSLSEMPLSLSGPFDFRSTGFLVAAMSDQFDQLPIQITPSTRSFQIGKSASCEAPRFEAEVDGFRCVGSRGQHRPWPLTCASDYRLRDGCGSRFRWLKIKNRSYSQNEGRREIVRQITLGGW